MAYVGHTAHIPIGFLGFSGSKNPSQQQAGHFSYVDNVAIDGSLIQKIGGASKYNSTAAGAGDTILAGAWHVPFDSATAPRAVIFLDDGSVRHDGGSGTFSTTAVSSLNVDNEPPPVFVSGGGEDTGEPAKLFLFSASNQVQVSQSEAVTTMAAIADPPADWTGGDFPTFGVVHEGRLWGGGANGDPHRIYYSSADDQEDFATNGGSLSIRPGIGERLVGGISFKGALVLFKYPKGIFLINTTDPSPAGWILDDVSFAVGTLSQHTIVPIDNDVLYLDKVGNIHSLAATNKRGGVETSNISQKSDLAEFIRSNVKLANIRRSVGLWYGNKQQAWFCMPSAEAAGNDNNIRVVLDTSNPQIGLRFLLSRRDTIVSLWEQPDANDIYSPVHGDDAGFVWTMDEEARNKDGSAYTMYFETANTDLSFLDPILAVKDKTAEFLELVYEPQGEWTVEVTMFWDDVPTGVYTFSMGGTSGEVLDTFELDADALASTAVTSRRLGVSGSGRRVKFSVSQSGDDQNVALVAFYLSFYVMDERDSSNA